MDQPVEEIPQATEEVPQVSKVAIADKDSVALLVIEIPKAYDLSDEDLDRAREGLEERFGVAVLITSEGVKAKFVTDGKHIYHREVLGAYEVEVVANTEEDLRNRLLFLQELSSKINAQLADEG